MYGRTNTQNSEKSDETHSESKENCNIKTARTVNEALKGNQKIYCITSRGRKISGLAHHSNSIKVKLSKSRGLASNKGRTCSNKYTKVSGSVDIRTYLEQSSSSSTPDTYDKYSVDSYTNGGVVSVKDEDGTEVINYPTHTDRGFNLFSLSDFDNYTDLLAQDELQERIETYWNLYKEG